MKNIYTQNKFVKLWNPLHVAAAFVFTSLLFLPLSLHAASPAWVTVDKTMLTQVAELGANPETVSFKIWNTGPSPRSDMDYTITSDVWWIRSLGTDTVIAGTTNDVDIVFNDMTAFTAGVYTGMLTIVGQDTEKTHPATSAEIKVIVSILTLPAPTFLEATAGEYDDRVVINWSPVAPILGGSCTYDVWRGQTRDFDEQYVIRIVGGLQNTTYVDNLASAGEIYYYWVRAVNGYDGAGGVSPYDIGYRALGAPAGIWASTGEYYDKVYLRWSGVDGAQIYEVWRADPEWTLVLTTQALEYHDFTIEEGVYYQYKIKALKNGSIIQPSSFSKTVEGFVLSRPANLKATQGSLVGKVRLTWDAAWGATEYEVWRLRGALYERIATVQNLLYDDLNVTPGTKYTYKLKGRNSSGVTEFGSLTVGYAGAVSTDLKVEQPIVLPHNLRPGASPSLLSIRIRNQGNSPATGDNGKVSIKYYAYSFASDTTTCIGSQIAYLNLPAGATQLLRVPKSVVQAPLQEDLYSIRVEVMPAWPSLLTDINPLNNTAAVRGNFDVDALACPYTLGFNDYDGDGISDLAVNLNGSWFVRTVDGRQLGWDVSFGGSLPSIYGVDMDGDQCAEPMVFKDGNWQAMLSAHGYALGALNYLAPGLQAVPGDYTGNGVANVAAYSPYDSSWYVLNDNYVPLIWGEVFGAPGMQVVPGDYDGDGVWDLLLFDKGKWYGRATDGSMLLWDFGFGSASYIPVMGDYDGDGIFDLALYRQNQGAWFILKTTGEEIIRNYSFGGPDWTPVPGDYDGDGVWDLALYNSSTGYWKIESLQYGRILAETLWGVPGVLPVGAQQ